MSKSRRSFGRDEIADAYKRFKAHEYETPVQRFELEDSPTPQEQKANLADLILKQRDEVTTLRQQLAECQARCAELAHHLGQAHKFIESTEAFGSSAARGALQAGDDYETLWYIDRSKDALAGISSEPFILRKQLEQASARSEVSFYQGACVTLSMFDPHSTEYHEAVLQHGGYEALWAIASDYDKEHLLSAATANFGRGYAQRLRQQADELEHSDGRP